MCIDLCSESTRSAKKWGFLADARAAETLAVRRILPRSQTDFGAVVEEGNGRMPGSRCMRETPAAIELQRHQLIFDPKQIRSGDDDETSKRDFVLLDRLQDQLLDICLKKPWEIGLRVELPSSAK